MPYSVLSHDENKPTKHKSHAFQWIEDSAVTQCLSCAVPFTLTTRKHHCRQCGSIVCSSCSKSRLALPTLGYDQPVRICIECYCQHVAVSRGIDLPYLSSFATAWLNGNANQPKSNHSYAAENIGYIQQRKAKLVDKLHEIALEIPQLEREHSVTANQSIEQQPSRQRTASSDPELSGLDEIHKQLQRQLNSLAQLAAKIQDELTEIRTKSGHVSAVVLQLDAATAAASTSTSKGDEIWQQRLLIITPPPMQLVALTSFLSPPPSLRISHHQLHKHQKNTSAFVSPTNCTDIRYRFIATIDELQSAGQCRATVRSTANKNVLSSGISLVWSPTAEPQQADADKTGLPNTSTDDILTSTPMKPLKRSTSSACSPYSTELCFVAASASPRSRHRPMPNEAPVSPIRHEARSEQGEMLQTMLCNIHAQQARLQVQHKIFDRMYSDMHEAVSWEDQSHVAMLQRLWNACFGEDQIMPTGKCDSWQLIGFQGSDPITDFRGQGLLGLSTLVDMGEIHSQLLTDLVSLQTKRQYPLACTVINLVHLITELLGFHQPNGFTSTLPHNQLYHLFATAHPTTSMPWLNQYTAFSSLIATMTSLIDSVVVETASGYMQFPTVFATVKQRLATVLARHPANCATLIQMLLHDTQWAHAFVATAQELTV